MHAARRKPVGATPVRRKRVAGVDADEIPLGVKNLIVVTLSSDVDSEVLEDARSALQKVLGADNVVVIVPNGCRLEVISLTADEGERVAVKVARPNARWNI
jgi:hypothetical protein